MSHAAVRIWLGWRAPDYANDWPGFVKQLGLNFIPVTWEAMQDFHLRTYVPSVLSASKATGLPEETALLCYDTVDDYRRQADTIAGRCYRLLHRVLFSRSSLSDWAVPNAAPGKPALRPASGAGRHFDDPLALIHFIALSHPAGATLTTQQVWSALPSQTDAAAAWCRPGQTLVWIAASQALDRQQTTAALQAQAADSDCRSWQVARPAPKLDQIQGVPVSDESSLHFSR